ncbi:hypothetical protein, partial [uncultured Methanobrevibacter sp.]|uniref:hypothetical protein n=1 Tax=uncultured Methanobrevibacter sp. TaxID=253161 RepID=UPI0026208D86
MNNHSFLFIDDDFPDISKFCMRMEKNIVEGDGVDAVIWAGKIAERITTYIAKFMDLNVEDMNQLQKLELLHDGEALPDMYYKELNTIRHYRNIATHHDLRDELKIAYKFHRSIFKILRWFYATYSGNPAIFEKKYMGITYQHDSSFIDMIQNKDALKNSLNNIPDNDSIAYYPNPNLNSALNSNIDLNQYVSKDFSLDNVFFNEDLNCWTAVVEKNKKVITIGHYKTKETALKRGYAYVNSDEFKNYTYISIPPKLKGGIYSREKGIGFSEDYKLWTAKFDKKFLGYFTSENLAKIARKEYIDTLPMPEPKFGSYSEHKEISFDRNKKLWYIEKDGEIYDYFDSEEEAIRELPTAFPIKVSSNDLGISFDEDSSKWRFSYRGKFVRSYDSVGEALKKRLEYVAGFAQPKKNKNGDYSIHKGIFYDEENLIWYLKIKDVIIGFFDTEEDAFNSKKEFLKSKGVDVSNLIFNQEESFDDNLDFKVNIFSEENSIVFDEESDEWVAYFNGNPIGRDRDKDSIKNFRRQFLRNMPFPPKKDNGEYSYFEGIGYDLDSHLWTASYGDESLGLFDSEEDAFYARKEALVADGVDVRDMHFNLDFDESKDIILDIKSSDSTMVDYGSSLLKDDSAIENKDLTLPAGSDRLNPDSAYGQDSVDADAVSAEDDALVDADTVSAEVNALVDADAVLEEDEVYSLDSSDSSLFDLDGSEDEIGDIKNSPFYAIASKRDENNLTTLENISYDDLESDDGLEDDEDYELNLDDKFEDNGFSTMGDDIDLKLNRRNLKEIKLKNYDSNNYGKEITISYNDENLYLTLKGFIEKNDLRELFSLNLLDNSQKLEFNKVDNLYFAIFFRLKYGLESISLSFLMNLLNSFGWDFDLLNVLLSNDKDGSLNLINFDFCQKPNEINPRSSDFERRSYSNNSLELSSESNLSSAKNLKEKHNPNSLFNDVSNISSKNLAKEDSSSKSHFNSSVSNSSFAPSNFNNNSIKDSNSDKNKKKTSKTKVSSKKKIVRGGKVVTEEEARLLDSQSEAKEIKTPIIKRKPKTKKTSFNTNSLGAIAKFKGFSEYGSQDYSDNLSSMENDDESLSIEDIFLTEDDDSGFDLKQASADINESDDLMLDESADLFSNDVDDEDSGSDIIEDAADLDGSDLIDEIEELDVNDLDELRDLEEIEELDVNDLDELRDLEEIEELD